MKTFEVTIKDKKYLVRGAKDTEHAKSVVKKRFNDAMPVSVESVVYKLGDYSILKYKDKKDTFIVVKNYDGSNPYMGGGTVSFNLESAKNTVNSYITMDKLDQKYGKSEGYRRWMAGKTDSKSASNVKDAKVLGYVVKLDGTGWVAAQNALSFSGQIEDAFLFPNESSARQAVLSHNDYFQHKGYNGKFYMWQRIEWAGGPSGTFKTNGSRGIPIPLIPAKNFDD